jgi:hypothetical protein
LFSSRGCCANRDGIRRFGQRRPSISETEEQELEHIKQQFGDFSRLPMLVGLKLVGLELVGLKLIRLDELELTGGFSTRCPWENPVGQVSISSTCN